MVQGDAYEIEIMITNDGEQISIEDISIVEVSLFYLQKRYPEDVAYSDGKFRFPLTQQETFNLPRICKMQVRVKFKSGDVIGSMIQEIDVERALSKVVL